MHYGKTKKDMEASVSEVNLLIIIKRLGLHRGHRNAIMNEILVGEVFSFRFQDLILHVCRLIGYFYLCSCVQRF